MLTLKNLTTNQTIELDAGLMWSDEFAWSSVEMATSRSLSGALIIETAVKQGGRPLTLSNSDDCNWCDRQTLLTLQGWCNTPACALLITLQNGGTHTVTPDCTNGNALTAKPITELPSFDDADEFNISLKLLEIVL